MKRTIIFCLSALLLLSSCEVTEGERHEPINVGSGIVYWTNEHVTYITNTLESLFIIDHYLATDPALRQEELGERAQGLVVEYNDTTNTIAVGHRYDSGTVYNYHNIVTDGRLLSEGGTWSIDKEAIVIANTPDGMTATFDTSSPQDSQIDAKLRIEEYRYVKGKRGFHLKYDGEIDVVTSGAYDYTLGIDIRKSMEYGYIEGVGRGIVGGELDVDYNYAAREEVDEVYMVYGNDGNINFSYRGYNRTTR